MSLLKLGFVGQRGMVGSVLIDRMLANDDFSKVETTFFSTSQKGQKAPSIKGARETLADANNVSELSKMDIILTCQGGDYTKEIHPQLRKSGWKGFWIDAASSLRMNDNAIIILDPINNDLIQTGIKNGVRDFIGGNCTVSLMLLGMHGLIKNNLVEWITSMTYQAASGAGARHMKELLAQMGALHSGKEKYLTEDASALELERQINKDYQSPNFPKEMFGHPLAANILPWIDTQLENGQSREEWKGMAEANKILGTKKPLPIDGTCVRVGLMRCHAQALTVKLTKDVPLNEINDMLKKANEWVKFVPNQREETLKKLTPETISGTLEIGVGRVRKMSLGESYLNVFTLGDQLLWGAAEPLRRMLRILTDR